MATMIEMQLAQHQPTTTSPEEITLNLGTAGCIITRVEIENCVNTNQQWSIYHDIDNTVYDTTTAVCYQKPILNAGHVSIRSHWGVQSSSEHMAVQATAVSSVTFTFYGVQLNS